MQSSGMALVHLAKEKDITTAQIATLTPGDATNIARNSVDVRAAILSMQFFENFSATRSGNTVTTSWNGEAFAKVQAAEAATLAAQVKLVRSYTDQRNDRAGEILTQLSTLVDYYLGILGLQVARAPYLSELLVLTQQIAGASVMTAKHYLACRRPDEIDSRIMPLIPAPTHGSLPSGHATQAIALATVVDKLLYQLAGDTIGHIDKRRDLTWALAHRIAVNRTVAGVHYPMDSWAGAVIGRGVGHAITALGQNTTQATYPFSHDPNADGAPTTDFLLQDMKQLNRNPATEIPGVVVGGDPINLGGDSAEFQWLWGKALTEISLLTGAT